MNGRAVAGKTPAILQMVHNIVHGLKPGSVVLSCDLRVRVALKKTVVRD